MLRAAGINPFSFETANIREHCGWVHMNEPEAAKNKAIDLTKMAAARNGRRTPRRKVSLDVRAHRYKTDPVPRSRYAGGCRGRGACKIYPQVSGAAIDPIAKISQLKVCAARVEKLEVFPAQAGGRHRKHWLW